MEDQGFLHAVGRGAAIVVGTAIIGGFGYWFLSLKLKEDAYRSHLQRELGPVRRSRRSRSRSRVRSSAA